MRLDRSLQLKDLRKVSGVYEIVNTRSKKIYVGGSKNLCARYQLHKSDLEKGTHLNQHLQYAYNKYGAHRFVFRVILLCSAGKVKSREQREIDRRWGPQLYNICKDARAPMRGRKFSEEHKRNLSASIKKTYIDNPALCAAASERVKKSYRLDPTLRGRIAEGNRRAHADPEVKKRHAAAVRLSHSRPETKAKISAIHKGKIISLESRRKMSIAAKNRKR